MKILSLFIYVYFMLCAVGLKLGNQSSDKKLNTETHALSKMLTYAYSQFEANSKNSNEVCVECGSEKKSKATTILTSYSQSYKNLKNNSRKTSKFVEVDNELQQTILSRQQNLQISAFISSDSEKLIITQSPKVEGHKRVAFAEFYMTRNTTGWDQLHVKTYNTFNPLIQCWVAGYIEGLLTHNDISSYYINLKNSLFKSGKSDLIGNIKNFFSTIDNNFKAKIGKIENTDFFATFSFVEIQKFSYQNCIYAQLNGIKEGYNLLSKDQQLDILDFYLINSEGNVGDIKSYIKMNKKDLKARLKETFLSSYNLKLVYGSDDLKQIWKNLSKKGHCSALVKLLYDVASLQYDIYLGHNTWTDYSELIRTLKHFNFEFEGSEAELALKGSIGMKSVELSFSSYPGVLFSGDDFYLINKQLGIAQTTLTSVNKFIYQSLIDTKDYIPEFMRIMTTNYMSTSGKMWFENYNSYSSHMYITQWLIVDFSVLKDINKLKKEIKSPTKITGLLTMVEEVPKSIRMIDLTEFLFQYGHFGSFNLGYLPENSEILGLTSLNTQMTIFSKENNPRYYLFEKLSPTITDLKSFANVLMYNNYGGSHPKLVVDDPSENDPSNGISSRDDISFKPTMYGGIDFKIITLELVNKMTIYAYGGPTYSIFNSKIEPLNLEKYAADNPDLYRGIPKLWKFLPINFPEKPWYAPF